VSSGKEVNMMVNARNWKIRLAIGLLILSIVSRAGGSVGLNEPFPGDIQDLMTELESKIVESGAEVSVAFAGLDTRERFSINPEEMHAASLMKVPVMIEVFNQASLGRFSLADKILVINEFKSIVDGSPYSLAVIEDSDDDIYRFIGKEMSIRELVHRMITVSSNLATNVLIQYVGAKNIMRTLTERGIHGMRVLRGVEDIKAYEKGLNNRTDAASMLMTLELIAEGKAGTKEACQEMIEILSQQKHRSKIPAGIPADVKVANKTGSITQIDHDAAIVFPEGRRPYVLVVMTRGIEKREDAERLIAELSRIVYDHVIEKQEMKS
jgi:beta-lactamase class A